MIDEDRMMLAGNKLGTIHQHMPVDYYPSIHLTAGRVTATLDRGYM